MLNAERVEQPSGHRVDLVTVDHQQTITELMNETERCDIRRLDRNCQRYYRVTTCNGLEHMRVGTARRDQRVGACPVVLVTLINRIHRRRRGLVDGSMQGND